MKRYIVNILLFFGIVAVIDIFVGFVGDYLQAHAKGGSTKEFNDLVKNDKHDILVLGSSRAHHHYDSPFLSDTLGLDVYNAGYNGNGVILAYGILEMTLKNYKPKLVIFDVEPAFDINVYSEDNQHKRYISNLKPYYNIEEIGSIIKDISVEEWYKVHSGMMRYNTDIIKMTIDNVICRSNPVKGFTPINGVYVDETNKDDKFGGKNETQIDTLKIYYIERLICLAQNNDVPIMLVASPKYNATASSVYAPVKTICKKQNVPFYDYYASSAYKAHVEWFNEPMHLNRNGARHFSEEILEDINSIIR